MMAYTRMGHASQDAIVPLHLSEATTLTCSVSLKSGESSSLLESSRRRCSLRLCFGDAIWTQHRGDSIMSDTRSGLDRILFTQDTEQASLQGQLTSGREDAELFCLDFGMINQLVQSMFEPC